jgi:hypothetical protein
MAQQFTASKVAKSIGEKLGIELTFIEADGFDATDGEVDITSRVHIQVGDNYLIVNAWEDEMTMRSWPVRRRIAQVVGDIKAAMKQYPVAA